MLKNFLFNNNNLIVSIIGSLIAYLIIRLFNVKQCKKGEQKIAAIKLITIYLLSWITIFFAIFIPIDIKCTVIGEVKFNFFDISFIINKQNIFLITLVFTAIAFPFFWMISKKIAYRVYIFFNRIKIDNIKVLRNAILWMLLWAGIIFLGINILFLLKEGVLELIIRISAFFVSVCLFIKLYRERKFT